MLAILFGLALAPAQGLESAVAGDTIRDAEFVYECTQSDGASARGPFRVQFQTEGTILYTRDGCVRHNKRGLAGKWYDVEGLTVARSLRNDRETREQSRSKEGKPVAQTVMPFSVHLLRNISDSPLTLFFTPYFHLADAKTRAAWRAESSKDGMLSLSGYWLRDTVFTVDPAREFTPVGYVATSENYTQTMRVLSSKQITGGDGARHWFPLAGVCDCAGIGNSDRNMGVPNFTRLEFTIVESTVKLNRGLKPDEIEVKFDDKFPIYDLRKAGRAAASPEMVAAKAATPAQVANAMRNADRQIADAMEATRSAAVPSWEGWPYVLAALGVAGLAIGWRLARRRG